MKKIIFLLIGFFACVFNGSAFETNDVFAIKEQEDVEGYQQYVGKEFYVRNAIGLLESWYKSGFDPEKYVTEGTLFTITKIESADVAINGKDNKIITIYATQSNGKKKIKINAYQDPAVKMGFFGDIKQYALIGRLPIVFTEAINEFKSQHVGEKITTPAVKDAYEITNAFIGESSDLAYVMVNVKNLRTNETFKYPYIHVSTKAFESALEGSYKTSLVRVEKPEDMSERYGKTDTITENGITKYTYADSIINITIFGDSQQFSYVLSNKSPHSLKVIWNEGAFVGLDGTSSKIMHVGTKFSEREGDQPATTIIRGAKLDDIATPTCNVYYDEGTTIGYKTIGNGWKTKSMLPDKYQGKVAGEIKLMIPIQIKDTINEYTFVFKVYYTYKHPELLNMEAL